MAAPPPSLALMNLDSPLSRNSEDNAWNVLTIKHYHNHNSADSTTTAKASFSSLSFLKPDPRFCRKPKEATWNELCILIQIFRMLESLPSSFQQDLGSSRRNQLSAIAGVSHDIAQKAIKYYHNENGFQECPPPSESIEGTKRGRPKKPLDDQQKKRIKTIVNNLNETGAACTSTVVQNHLQVTHKMKVLKPTLLRQLKLSGLKYATANRDRKGHESPANVEHRMNYVRKRLSNLDGNFAPIQPEVFLDESYIHVNRNISNGWMDPSTDVYPQEKHAVIVIFGAFVVHRDQETVKAGFVKDHIIIWPAEVGYPFKGQEKCTDAVPVDIVATETAPRNYDYHGYPNGDNFEKLFICLCNKLNELGHKECIIHMDGASYHVRNSDRVPTKTAGKEAMISWLRKRITTEHAVEETADDNNDENDNYNNRIEIDGDKGITQNDEIDNKLKDMTKAQLIERIEQWTRSKENKYNTSKIAKERGHTILKTPPYHCELQPMENVWVFARKRLTEENNVDDGLLPLHIKLHKVFSEIPSSTLLKFWTVSIDKCRAYLTQLDS